MNKWPVWIDAKTKPDDARDVIIRFDDGWIESSRYTGRYFCTEHYSPVTHWCDLPTFDSSN